MKKPNEACPEWAGPKLGPPFALALTKQKAAAPSQRINGEWEARCGGGPLGNAGSGHRGISHVQAAKTTNEKATRHRLTREFPNGEGTTGPSAIYGDDERDDDVGRGTVTEPTASRGDHTCRVAAHRADGDVDGGRRQLWPVSEQGVNEGKGHGAIFGPSDRHRMAAVEAEFKLRRGLRRYARACIIAWAPHKNRD